MFRRTGWLHDFCRGAPQIDGCHWRLKAECLTLSARPSIMAPRYSDPENISEILSYQAAKVGHYGQGLPPVKLNIEFLKLWWLRLVYYNFLKCRSAAHRESVALKKGKIIAWFLSWYSALNLEKSKPRKCLIYKRNLLLIKIIHRCSIRQQVTHPRLQILSIDHR